MYPILRRANHLIAAYLKDDLVVFVVYCHEPHRSPTQAAFDPAVADRVFLLVVP